MECIISKFNTSVEILKSSSTYNFAWQKSGGGMGPPPPPPPQFCRPCMLTMCTVKIVFKWRNKQRLLKIIYLRKFCDWKNIGKCCIAIASYKNLVTILQVIPHYIATKPHLMFQSKPAFTLWKQLLNITQRYRRIQVIVQETKNR